MVRPRIIVCLGSTAAQALLGSGFRVSTERGKFMTTPSAEWITATVHPSSILRAPDDETRRAEREALIKDLRKVAQKLGAAPAIQAASTR